VSRLTKKEKDALPKYEQFLSIPPVGVDVTKLPPPPEIDAATDDNETSNVRTFNNLSCIPLHKR
jgi:hypothetical protein